ncbi:hypothetical protein [Actinocrispum wychmicini]|uniref:hypothetical protein n=1 Tax=Actinocrispum wychmicini TaxID=1213861 RepID=UPI00104A0AC7|nr:hypothetical protein [Actinocrispum wychmicini]
MEAAAKLFEDSADAVNDLIRGGREHLRMQPMADDDVSKRAARSFTDAGVEGPESHVAALTGYQKWLLLIAFNIRASAAQYWRTDNDTARTAHVSGLGGLARD